MIDLRGAWFIELNAEVNYSISTHDEGKYQEHNKIYKSDYLKFWSQFEYKMEKKLSFAIL